MQLAALCAVVAGLRVVPNRSQFFQYESVSLICEQLGNASRWGLKRSTSAKTSGERVASWDGGDGCDFLIPDLYPSDSGVYWCESGAGQRSNAASITVTAGAVILESPARPVPEGEAVTLRCSHRATSSLRPTSRFYKDGVLLGTSSTGNLTLHSVSSSDEGRYKCSVSAAESPDSWLEVREAGRPEPSQATLALVLLPVAFKCLCLISLLLRCLCSKHKDAPQRQQSCCCSAGGHGSVGRPAQPAAEPQTLSLLGPRQTYQHLNTNAADVKCAQLSALLSLTSAAAHTGDARNQETSNPHLCCN